MCRSKERIGSEEGEYKQALVTIDVFFLRYTIKICVLLNLPPGWDLRFPLNNHSNHTLCTSVLPTSERSYITDPIVSRFLIVSPYCCSTPKGSPTQMEGSPQGSPKVLESLPLVSRCIPVPQRHLVCHVIIPSFTQEDRHFFTGHAYI